MVVSVGEKNPRDTSKLLYQCLYCWTLGDRPSQLMQLSAWWCPWVVGEIEPSDNFKLLFQCPWLNHGRTNVVVEAVKCLLSARRCPLLWDNAQWFFLTAIPVPLLMNHGGLSVSVGAFQGHLSAEWCPWVCDKAQGYFQKAIPLPLWLNQGWTLEDEVFWTGQRPDLIMVLSVRSSVSLETMRS